MAVDSSTVIALLPKFHMTIERNAAPQFAARAEKLLNESGMNELLDVYQPCIKAPDRTVPAAFSGSWLNWVALAKLYFMSEHNISLRLTLDAFIVELNRTQAGYSYFRFVLDKLEWEEGPEDEIARKEWRSKVLGSFYSGTIKPVFESAAAVSGVAIQQLWGQMPTTLNYTMEKLKAREAGYETVHTERLLDDYHYLCHELPPEAFGLNRNPLRAKLRLIEDIADSGKQTMMRNICCLAYRTEGGQLCYNCPKLKEEERAARREAYRAAQAAQ